MRRAIGVAMALLFSFPLIAGTITGLSPSSIPYKGGEFFLTVSGTGFSATDTLVFYDPYSRHEVTVNAIDAAGAVTGWVPQEVVNDPGTWSVYVRGANGDSAPVNFWVTKPGRLPFKIHLPEYITALARSSLGTGIKYNVTTSGGDGSLVTVNCEPASGSMFPYGISKVSCTAWNEGGERDSDSAQVNVWDGTAPVLTVPKSFEVVADSPEGAWVKYETSATDNIDGALRVVCDRDSGTLFPNGRTRVNCEAVDNALNPAYGSFEVFVQPADPGYLKVVVPEVVKAEATDKYGAHVTFEVYATGSADPDPVVECTPASDSYFRIGETKVYCMATDDFGQRAEAGFYVSVYESSFLRGEDLYVEATSPSGAEVTWDIKPSETWAAAVACSPAPGSLFAFGETSVECSSTDAAGEPVTGKFKVTVQDTTAPHIENVRTVVGNVDVRRQVVPVNVEVDIIDAGDASPRCSVTALNSDTALDWTRTSELSFELRNAAGRTFRAQVTCVDASGNSATSSVPVSIAKERPVKVN